MERVGDVTYLHQLEQYANAVTALKTGFLSLIEAAPSEERFHLYWTYNHLTGSWFQVEYLQTLLELSLEAKSYSDEASIRTSLRDQAEFVRWELGYAVNDLKPYLRSTTEPPVDQRDPFVASKFERPSIICGPTNVRICHALPAPTRPPGRTGMRLGSCPHRRGPPRTSRGRRLAPAPGPPVEPVRQATGEHMDESLKVGLLAEREDVREIEPSSNRGPAEAYVRTSPETPVSFSPFLSAQLAHVECWKSARPTAIRRYGWPGAARANGGSVTTVEVSEYKVGLATADFAQSPISSTINLIHADAGQMLHRAEYGSFDLVFPDSERSEYPAWWPDLRRVLRPGG